MIRKFGLLVIGASLLVSAATARADIDPKQFSAAMGKYLSTEAGQKAIGDALESYKKIAEERAVREGQSKALADLNANLGGSPVKGPAKAKVTIVEFSDFQCPYCKRGHDTMDEVMKAYPNDVKVIFKNFPLQFHPNALPAAKAALAAHKQGKFWEMHDALFANQGALAPALYEDEAKKLGLNVDKFKADMASPEVDKQIKDDQALGGRNGIQGTPGFFVNGIAVKGAYPVDYFKNLIDSELKK